MDVTNTILRIAFAVIVALFFFAAVALGVFAVIELWDAVNPTVERDLRARFNAVVESIGLLTIAVAALGLGQTILDEEVRRRSEMSVPTRVRRFISRFMVVIIVSLSIEFLVVVFRLIHEDPARLLEASALGLATAALLAAWGLFLHHNRAVEELEPEALEQVKREDADVGATPPQTQ